MSRKLGEQRGRVVLKLGCFQPNKVALTAAIRVAQAFRSEIESLFIEEPAVYDAARLSFTREVSLSGRYSRDLTVEGMAREMRHLAEQLIRQVDMMARIAEVPTRASIVRNEPLKAMAEACRACGPWNIIALSDCRMPRSGAEIQQLFEEVADTTGLVFVGPKARTSHGPVIVAIEDAERVEDLVRTASRLVLPDAEPALQLLLIADDETRLGELDGQVRLALGPTSELQILRAAPAHGSPLGPAETLRRLAGGFAIAELGRRLVPLTGDLGHLAAALECPMLVVR